MRRQLVFSMVLMMLVISLTSVTMVAAQESDRWTSYTDGLNGTLSSISVGYTRQVIGTVAGNPTPFSFDRRSRRWVPWAADPVGDVVTRGARQLLISCDSSQWALDAAGRVFRRLPGQTVGEWQRVGNIVNATFLAVGKGEDAWIIDANGVAQYFLASTRDFFAAGIKLRSLGVGCDGAVWGVDSTSSLQQYVEGAWELRGSGVSAVAVRDNIYVLMVGSNSLMQLASAERLTPQSSWYDFNRKFTSFSAGPDGTLWGIDVNGVAWDHRGENMESRMNEDARQELNLRQGGQWSVVRGSAGISQVCTGMIGEIYGVSKTGTVKRYNQDSPDTWEDIPSPPSVVRIGCGCDGLSLWAVTADSLVHRYNGNGRWTRFNEMLDTVSVGLDADAVYGIKQENKYLLNYNRKDNRWIRVTSMGTEVELQALSAGCDRSIWGVDLDGNLRSSHALHNPGVWANNGQGARSVAVGKKVYILDDKDYLFEYREASQGVPEGKQNWKMMYKQLTTVAANQHGEVMGIDLEGRLVRFVPNRPPARLRAWRKLKVQPVKQLAVGSRNDIYALDKYGVVLRLGSNKQWAPMTGITLRQLSVGCDGSAWGLNAVGDAWKMDELELGWERVQPDVNKLKPIYVSVGRRNIVWGIDEEGMPIRWHPKSRQWKLAGFSPRERDPFVSISVSCRGNRVWAVGKSGITYSRSPKSPHVWRMFRINTLSVAVGYRTYVIDKNHFLWKFEKEKQARSPFDKWIRLGPMVDIATAIDGTTLGLDRTGQVYLLHPGRDPKVPPPAPRVRATPTVAPPPSAPQPDGKALSPFLAGSQASSRIVSSVNDPDDVTAIIKAHEEELKYRRLADAQSPYSSFDTDLETFGNTHFNTIDSDQFDEMAAKRQVVPAGQVFSEKPPF